MTDFNTLPSRTQASLGPDLTDPGFAVAVGFQPSTHNLDEWANWIMKLAEWAGKETDPAAGSIREALARLGWGNPRYQRQTEHFLYRNAGALDTIWNLVSGAWALVDTIGGQIRAPQDGGVESFLRSHGYDLYRAALPAVHCRVKFSDVQALSPVWRCGAIDAAGQEGFGVEFLKSASDYFRVWTMTGGARTYAVTDVAPVIGAWNAIRIRLTGTPGAQNTVLEIDGVVEATETTAIGHAAMARYSTIGSGGIAGKYVYLDWLGFEQDVSQADT